MQGRGAAADAEFEPALAQHVGGRRGLGDADRMVQRQQGDGRAEANAARALCGGRQYHQRIGKDRKGAAEVEFAKPGGIETERLAQFDLRQDVGEASALGVALRARQLVEEAEPHPPLQRAGLEH